MKAGDRVDGRFEIERVAGQGGMGVVYKAHDRRAGRAVALKVLGGQSDDGAERFAREGRALAGLEHPGIVRYVAHGFTPASEPYLAMEWLEGESLSERIARAGRLDVGDAVELVARVADALHVAHRRGIVHRDLKPSNLFLDGGELARVKILDFGIARVGTTERTLTSSGAILGTPGYLSPEQARGSRGIDARSDVFSLGCVLFKCLTGESPFEADDMLAVLLKLILDAPPALRTKRPDASPELEALVARMLDHAPDQRPADAAAAARLLRALPRASGGGAPVELAPRGISGAERRVTTLLVSRIDAGDHATDATDALRRLVEQHRGHLDVLEGGVVAVAFARSGATDQAAFAARCALAMQLLLGDARAPLAIALVTGRADVARDRVEGGALLDDAERLAQRPGIWVDAATADLLGPGFELAHGPGDRALLGEREPRLDEQPAFEHALPLVGRERELALLGSHYRESASGPVTRAVVISGEPGIGKSRVVDAFARRLASGEDDLRRPGALWFVRASPAAGPLGLLAALVGRAAGVAGGDSREAQERKLEALARRAGAPAAVEPLRRLLGLREPARMLEHELELDEPEALTERTPLSAEFIELEFERAVVSPERVERVDEAAVRAFEGVLERECHASAPVVLVLEDLHLADARSLEAVATALRDLDRLPLFVLATTRARAHAAFGADAPAAVLELRLRELSRRHAERLAREALDDDGDGRDGRDGHDDAPALAARSLGRPFFLEELARASRRGELGWPDSVLGIIEGSLGELDAEARRVLRAASVFGSAFTPRAVDAVLGSDAETSAADWLPVLVAREIIDRGATADDPRETEYAFRLDVVRAAAYASLTADDARAAHRLAARFLRASREPDPRAIAWHLERSGDAEGAAELVAGIARAALRDGRVAEAADAIASSAFGHGAGPVGASEPALAAVRGALARWSGELARALEYAELARAVAPAGTDAAHEAEGEIAEALALVSAGDRLAELAARLRACCDAGPAPRAHLIAAARAAHALALAGQRSAARELLETVRRDRRAVEDPEVAGHRARAAAAAHLAEGDLLGHARELEIAAGQLERAGAMLDAAEARVACGYAALRVGRVAEAAHAFDAALATAQAHRVAPLESLAKAGIGQVLRARGALEEAHAATRDAVRTAAAAGDRVREGFARALLARVEVSAGDMASADLEARVAAELLGASPRLRALPVAVAAQAALAQGDAARAMALAQEARELLDVFGALEHGEALVRVVHVEALATTGRVDVARTGLGLCRTWLLGQAARIHEPAAREAFLGGVEEHERIMALARAWTSSA